MNMPKGWYQKMKEKDRRRARYYRYVDSFLPGFMANEGIELVDSASYDREHLHPRNFLPTGPIVTQLREELDGTP